MKTLLRSMFVDQGEDPQAALGNYTTFFQTGLEFDIPEDQLIWRFIRRFVRAHNHVPELATLLAHFKHLEEDETYDRVEQLTVLIPKYRGDFDNYLAGKVEDRKVRSTTEILKEASTILSTGMDVPGDKKGETKNIKGPSAAIQYIMDKGQDIVTPALSAKLYGEVTHDGADFVKEYETVEADPLAGIGQWCGLAQIDAALSGAKRKELWTHAGFTGHLKSFFMLNWAYTQAVYFLHGSLIFSLEMPYNQCRRILYAIHSVHDKFKPIRLELGLQQYPDDQVGLPYTAIRDGRLDEIHPNARKFLMEYVVPDFNGELIIPREVCDPYTGQPWAHPEQYGSIHIEQANPDKNDFTVIDVKSRAEMIFSSSRFRTLFVDHMGLMAPRKWVSSTTDRLNEVIRDLKRLAMNFNRGHGMAVVGLFQISREGMKSALKAKEKTGMAGYNLTHLSYSNECIPGNTWISSDYGIIPMSEIRPGFRVWSTTGWKNVQEVFNQGVRPLWEIVTDRGSILQATANHQVRVLAGEKIVWREVSEISAGDFVFSTRGNFPWPLSEPSLPDLDFKKYEHKHSGEPLRIAQNMTVELAYLLGVWDGDGNSGGRFTGNRSEKAVQDRIQLSFESVFGLSLTVLKCPSRKGSFDLQNERACLRRWLDSISGPRGLEVPHVILQSPKDCMLAYLKGLFDTDGWINYQGVIGIKMAEKSEDFLRTIQTVLTSLGYDSMLEPSLTTFTGKNYAGWTLRLRGQDSLVQFAAEIGFTEPRKRKTLMQMLVKGVKDKRMYPVPETFLRAYSFVFPEKHSKKGCNQDRRALWKAVDVAKKKGLVSHHDIRNLWECAVTRGVTNRDLEILVKLTNLLVMQVAKIGPTGEVAPVYDLEVGGDHEYQTGPILSHNCERSSDVVTASWVDDDLIRQNRAQFQCLKSRDDKSFEPFLARVEFPCRRLFTCRDVIGPSMGGVAVHHDPGVKDLDSAMDELTE